jgi:hypothetical protein
MRFDWRILVSLLSAFTFYFYDDIRRFLMNLKKVISTALSIALINGSFLTLAQAQQPSAGEQTYSDAQIASLNEYLKTLMQDQALTLEKIDAVKKYSDDTEYKLYVDTGTGTALIEGFAFLFIAAIEFSYADYLTNMSLRDLTDQLDDLITTMSDEELAVLGQKFADQAQINIDKVRSEINLAEAKRSSTKELLKSMRENEGWPV